MRRPALQPVTGSKETARACSSNTSSALTRAAAISVRVDRFATAFGSQALRARGRRIGSRSFASRKIPFLAADTLIVPPEFTDRLGGLQRVEYETGVGQALL